MTIEPAPNDQLFFDQFRMGKWPNYFDNVQFDRKPETLDQFFRSVTPNTGPFSPCVMLTWPAGALGMVRGTENTLGRGLLRSMRSR